MKTLNTKEVEAFRERGYHVARDVFDGDEIARLREGYDYILELAARTDLPDAILQGKDREVHIHLQTPRPMVGTKAVPYLRKVQWPSLIHPAFEEIRNSAKFPVLLEPLIGTSLKQYINQINFKMPGGDIHFPWHQDIRPTPAFRDQVNNYVQTIIVVDEATVANGCLHIVPCSHKLGNLKVTRYAKGEIEDQVDMSSAVPCEAMPGDVVMFTSYTVHGSVPNTTDKPRRSYINGFVRASACDVGKWAFLDGKPVPITSDRDYHEIRYGTDPDSV
ncbi:MAG: phytanoyl-CoA dioxygenase family protein [Gemmatimonadetes bacterium]|nr:phytanoyl-CoA dioxygenase family protein [Gemmatimonadota bacterium]MYB55370.1 phytanoyl-CoA dioxygenase family protein [Gemmatimonadota bacterium]